MNVHTLHNHGTVNTRELSYQYNNMCLFVVPDAFTLVTELICRLKASTYTALAKSVEHSTDFTHVR